MPTLHLTTPCSGLPTASLPAATEGWRWAAGQCLPTQPLCIWPASVTRPTAQESLQYHLRFGGAVHAIVLIQARFHPPGDGHGCRAARIGGSHGGPEDPCRSDDRR